MTEQELIKKLEKIEQLFAGATTEGERGAAENAKERFRKKLEKLQAEKPEELLEFQFSIADPWSRKLFYALLRSYGLSPYRYKRQRRSTVVARMNQSFLDKTLWPEYQALDQVLREYVSEITEKVIQQHIFSDTSEAAEQEKNMELEF